MSLHGVAMTRWRVASHSGCQPSLVGRPLPMILRARMVLTNDWWSYSKRADKMLGHYSTGGSSPPTSPVVHSWSLPWADQPMREIASIAIPSQTTQSSVPGGAWWRGNTGGVAFEVSLCSGVCLPIPSFDRATERRCWIRIQPRQVGAVSVT